MRSQLYSLLLGFHKSVNLRMLQGGNVLIWFSTNILTWMLKCFLEILIWFAITITHWIIIIVYFKFYYNFNGNQYCKLVISFIQAYGSIFRFLSFYQYLLFSLNISTLEHLRLRSRFVFVISVLLPPRLNSLLLLKYW